MEMIFTLSVVPLAYSYYPKYKKFILVPDSTAKDLLAEDKKYRYRKSNLHGAVVYTLNYETGTGYARHLFSNREEAVKWAIELHGVEWERYTKVEERILMDKLFTIEDTDINDGNTKKHSAPDKDI